LGGGSGSSRPYNPGVVVETQKPELLLPDMHRWSLEEYHQLIESGGFDEDTRLELIDGFVVDMSPKTREHENAIAWLSLALQRALDHARFELRVASPLTLATSEPEPDLIVVEADDPRPYHPGSATLVVEVSVSSLRRDLRQKPVLYARAGIPRYWVIDVDGGRVVVHAESRPDGYARVETIGADGELAAPELGIRAIRVADVLAAARR
jgi:Uma2 family endonuclease